MKIPKTGLNRALIVIDLQPAFVKSHNEHIVENIDSLLNSVEYDTYVEAVFSAEKGSLWDLQQNWFCPDDKNTKTISPIDGILSAKQPLKIHKHTRSVFRGNQNLNQHLRDLNIEEIHLVGTETNDCVLASAFDAFDSGFAVFVLEECCESATVGRHQLGLEVLRHQSMTNNSCLVDTIEVEL